MTSIIVNDDHRASLKLSALLEGQKATGITMCQGDDNHPPHIEISFANEMTLMIQLAGHGDFIVGLSKKVPSAEHVDPMNYHEPSGALQ